MDPHDLAFNNLRHIDSSYNFKVILSMLRYIGNWPPIGRYRFLYMFYTLISFVLLPAIYVCGQAVYLIDIWGDIDKMIEVSFILMTFAVYGYKVLMIVVRQKRIQALLDITTGEIFSVDSAKYERIFTWYAWSSFRHRIAFQCIAGFVILCWIYAAIVEIIVGQEKHLPIEIRYPYDIKKSPNFEITCVYQIITMMVVTWHNITIDSLAINFISVACCQLDILKRNIENIGNDDEASLTSEDEACKQLNYCIEHNKVIMNFVTEIRDIFGTAIISVFGMNCIIMCLAAFHVTQMNDNDPVEIIGTVIYVFTVAYQIFTYCWHGNELVLQSESVSLAAYTGNWWKCSERYKSTLRILMIHSYRPMIIKVGGVMIISLPTFVSIIRMSYSLFTVLQSARSV